MSRLARSSSFRVIMLRRQRKSVGSGVRATGVGVEGTRGQEHTVHSTGSHARSHPSRLLRLGTHREGLPASRQAWRNCCAKGMCYCTRDWFDVFEHNISLCLPIGRVPVSHCLYGRWATPLCSRQRIRDTPERSLPPEFPFRLCVC